MSTTASDLLALAVAPFVGSFQGVVILRYAEPLSIVAPGSRCEACGHRLSPVDLVPFASWLVLRGRCRHCRAVIGWFYPGIELAALVIAAWAVVAISGWALWPTCLLGWILLALAVIDWRDFVLPDLLTLPLLAMGLIVAWMFDPDTLAANLIGAAGGFAFIMAVRIAYRRLRGCEGIGLGDAKLLAAAGAWVGWSGLPHTVLIGSLAGIAICLFRWARGDKISTADRMPFGAFLCAGIWVTWLYG
jgi:leader peptidase (prepilin peptidase)/N-methyltransferase